MARIPSVSKSKSSLVSKTSSKRNSYVEKGFNDEMVVRIVDVDGIDAFLLAIVVFQIVDVLIEEALHMFVGQIDA